MPLVVHPTSHCDVCMDQWSESLPPHAIACGHILCIKCIENIANNLCPFCRKPFAPNRVKKLHVALPDVKEASRTKATELLRKIALISGERSPLEDVVQVVEEANAWIAEHDEDQDEHQPLRSAIAGLRNFKQLKDKYNQDKHTYRRHKQQLVDRQKRFEADIQTAKAVENSLLVRLEEVEKEFTTKLAETEAEVASLRVEASRFRNTSNPLPPPPEPIPLHIFPSLASYQEKQRAKEQSKHRRRSQPPLGNGSVSDKFMDQHGPNHRSHDFSDPVQSFHQTHPTMVNHRSGIKPGARPAERFIPPKPQMPKQESGPLGGQPRNHMARSLSDAYYQGAANMHDGTPLGTVPAGYENHPPVDSGIRMSDGRDPFATSQAFLQGYENGISEATYQHGGYAPGYDDGRFNASSRREQDNSPVEGLGLLGVPDKALQTGSVTRRSALFRTTSHSKSRSGTTESPGGPSTSHTQRAGPSHTLDQILGNHSTPGTRRDGPSENRTVPSGRERSRPASISGSLVSSWGTVTNAENPSSAQGTGRGSLASLEMVNNFRRVVIVAPGEAADYEREDDGIATPMVNETPSQLDMLGTSWNQGVQGLGLGLQFGPSTREQRGHSRSLSMPNEHQDTAESENQPPSQNLSRIDRDQARQRTVSVLQHSNTEDHLSEPLQPMSSNGLGLTFDEPANGSSSILPHYPSGGSNVAHGYPRIHAPTPRHRHNVVRSWQNKLEGPCA